MVSMKLTAEQQKEATGTIPSDQRPEYPYGLLLRLEKDQIEKLGLGELDAGEEVALSAKGYIKTVSASESAEGPGYQCVEIQITDLAVSETGDLAQKMYPSGD